MQRLIYLTFLLTILLTSCGLLAQTAPPPIVTTAPPADAQKLLQQINGLEIPARDLAELAVRLGGAAEIPTVARTTPADESVGAEHDFWYKNQDNGGTDQVRARLVYQSDALNMWLDESVTVADTTIAEAAAHIESAILPTDRGYFGSEAQPGIDGDVRLNILHLKDIGGNAAGYFSSADLFVSAVNPFSNEREMLYVNLKAAPVASESYYSVIAHELLHLIHAYTDANEATWLDEGLAELAGALNGYPVPNRPSNYAARTDVQLNNLAHDPEVVGANYGASFLFTSYFLSRFGDGATQALMRDPANNITGVDHVLQMVAGLTFNDFFADWTAANYLTSRGLDYGIYQYDDMTIPEIELADRHRRFPVTVAAGVNQFGADYIQIEHDEPLTVTFTGSRQAALVAADAYSGDYFWSTYPADRSDVTLTGRFDLSAVTSATLTFQTWYDIEEGWDYAYVVVSNDDGASWTLLETAAMTRDNPHGNSYGPAFSGSSGGEETPVWLEQTADLSPFTGGEILLRFEYVTDDAVHLQGLALDDIAIPEIGFFDDGEAGPGAWQAAGFLHHQNILPQQFIVQAIYIAGGGGAVTVERLTLADDQSGSWTLALNPTQNEAILIVSGATPMTQQPAGYRYVIE